MVYLLLGTGVLYISCNEPYLPKKNGYQQYAFPVKSYRLFDSSSSPYTFEYPTYAIIDNKVNYGGFDQKSDASINILFPDFNAILYVSHKQIKRNQLDTLINDAYKFANNHSNKASYIEDSIFTTPKGVYGAFFHIGGEVATTYQFFLTDSTRHFFRGALYFNATPNEDSLAPMNAFLLQDVKHLVNTFRWK